MNYYQRGYPKILNRGMTTPVVNFRARAFTENFHLKRVEYEMKSLEDKD